MSWKLTTHAPRPEIEAALIAHEDAIDWDHDIVIAGTEIAENRPEDWRLEAWLPRRPTKADRRALDALFTLAPAWLEERLPDTDWVTDSQQYLEPVRAGAFQVRIPDHPPCTEPGVRNFVIPASQAFGTGQHATTAGCLEMLSAMKASGMVVRNCADIGTGTGLLAFAALALWPRALATASDIDRVCADVIAENARLNGVRLGGRAGEVAVAIAPGLDHPLIQARAPYDLLVANILARPLIDLMPDFARATVPGGSLLLAGLLATQEGQVRRAALRNGFRLARRVVRGDWSILWLRRRG
ncbi:50S ribosomal protein L11 methyltransferase [Novosphingobium sp. Gsoil 351]|uniref:50S ribosomal protein L11 methyltransferase n=1 Tax=Novosphingobium sp. Gsoil 351 TaxID=2675225 RepID=UPI0012B500F5|nr:50S ribosomal protein L11 methyltransferase [Novosphingobium sp. Gsoil 351]QGN53396.1 methyltransferase [Novosphingobium sp. Gsoil 351]